MPDKTKIEKARDLRAKGLSLRQISDLEGVSHVTIRTWTKDVTPPGRGGKAGARPKRRKAPVESSDTPDPRTASLLEIANALLSVLRRRAHEASHPTIRNRFAADAGSLAALVVRLERREASRADRQRISASETLAAYRSVVSQFRDFIDRVGPLSCVHWRR